jgi:hypothetical protein
MTILKIKVTEKHIRNGVPMSAFACPINLALSKYIKDGYRVACTTDSLFISKAYKVSQKIELPEKVLDFNKHFDTSQTLLPAPITFEIDIPNTYLKKEYVRAKPKPNK